MRRGYVLRSDNWASVQPWLTEAAAIEMALARNADGFGKVRVYAAPLGESQWLVGEVSRGAWFPVVFADEACASRDWGVHRYWGGACEFCHKAQR